MAEPQTANAAPKAEPGQASANPPAPQDAGKGQQQPSGGTPKPEEPNQGAQKEPAKSGNVWAADDAAKGSEATGEQGKEAPQGAPEKYELKGPKGEAYHPALLKGFEPLARELGLTNDGANKLLQSMGPVLDQVLAQRLEERNAQWKEQTLSHAKLGGTKFAEASKVAEKGFALAPPGIRELLIQHGFVHHPEFFEWQHAVGSTLVEDRFVGGKPVAAGGPQAMTLSAIARDWYGAKKKT